jgi:hypothetical protein
MPGAVANDGICSIVKPIEDLVGFAESIGQGRAP